MDTPILVRSPSSIGAPRTRCSKRHHVDLALGGIVSGKIPRPLMLRVITGLGECTDVELDGKPIRIGEPTRDLRARG